MLKLWIVLAALCLAGPAFGQNLDNPWAEGNDRSTVGLPPEVEGTVPWADLAEVELVMDENGMDLVPAFSDTLKALDGQAVQMVGFLLPLDSDGRRMLLSMVSPHCPFCMPGGPETFVELVSDGPIELTMEPVLVEGELELLKEAWNGYYYRLPKARVVREVTG